MKRRNNITRLLACTVLVAGGCGAVPDIVIETARERAIQAIENTVGNAVDDVIDGTFGELLDLDDLALPFHDQSQKEEEEALDMDTSESDERDRETRRSFNASSPLP